MSTARQSIRDIIIANPSAAPILQRFDIDIDKQTERTLDRACAACSFLWTR